MWSALPVGDSYGDIVKLLLLTGQRREKVWGMRWDDISIDGTWSVPNGTREKGAGGELVLPEMAVDIIRNRPRFEFKSLRLCWSRFWTLHQYSRATRQA